MAVVLRRVLRLPRQGPSAFRPAADRPPGGWSGGSREEEQAGSLGGGCPETQGHGEGAQGSVGRGRLEAWGQRNPASPHEPASLVKIQLGQNA